MTHRLLHMIYCGYSGSKSVFCHTHVIHVFLNTLLVETGDELETHWKLYDGDVRDEKVWQNVVDDVLCKTRS